MVRIAYLLQGLEPGGLERMAADLARGARGEHQPEMLCYDTLGELAEPLRRDGIPATLIRRRPGIDLRYPFRLARYLSERGVHLLHAHNDTALFYGTFGARIAQVPVVVYTEHDRVFPGRGRVAAMNRVLARLADAVVPVSHVLGELLRRHEGIEGPRVRVIHNGVDESPPPGPAERARARRDLGLGERVPVAGIFAGLKPVKCHSLLLQAWRRAADRMPGAVLLVVGEGPLRGELEARAAGLGLGARARFLGYRDAVRPLYAAVDAVVLSSRSEGLPLAVLEAMAAARPVVSTAVGGISEAVHDGVTGLLVPPGDAGALASALARVLGGPETGRRMGEAGRRLFERSFTRRAMVAGYLRLYRECLAARDVG